MADVITRFKLETTQYDSALRDASKGLAAYSKQAELAGKDFDKFTKGGVEAARALGNISTSATNTKEKVKELVSAYNDVARAYNNLTEDQKKSDFGKAMASSLEQLQGRIKDAKAEMNSTGGVLSQLRERFTVNIDALKLFSVGLQAAQGALGVVKDAFFKNEEQLDTWGRVVEASQSLYSGFLDALNTGDISGYLTRIGEITKAAQDAYNALDDLNTFNAFNQVNVEKTRTGMTESIADYRSGQGTKEQVKAAGEAYQKELRERQKLEKQAYLDAIKKVAAERGVNGQDLITALSGSYGSYKSLKAIPMSGTRTKFTPGGMFGGSTAYEEAYPVNRQEKLGAALRKLNDTELQSLQAIGAQAERTGNEIAQVDRQLTRVLNGRQPGSGGGGGGGGRGGSGGGKNEITYAADSIAAQSKLVQDLTKQWNEAGDDVRTGYLYQLIQAEQKLKEMKDQQQGIRNQESARASMTTITDTMGTDLSDVLGISATIEHIQEELDKNPIVVHVEKSTKDIKAITQAAQTTAEVVGSIGDAFNAIEDPAAKVAGTVAQAIATIAAGYATATTQAASMGPWAWVAFAATGLAQMFTMINAVHSATGYAQGGTVKGNSYSGDNVPALVDGSQMVGLNAGEVVLTAAQTNNLAAGIQNGGSRIQVVGKLSGEQLFICAERWAKRTGKGEFVTWR